MKGNKLKHNFVENSGLTPEILERWRNYFDQNTPPITINNTLLDWETIIVSEDVSSQLTTQIGFDCEYYLKRELSRKLADVLLENNFIETRIEERTYHNDSTRITMKLTVKKI